MTAVENVPAAALEADGETVGMGIFKQVDVPAPPGALRAVPYARVTATLRLLRPPPPSPSGNSDESDEGKTQVLMSGKPMELWLTPAYETNSPLAPAVNACLLSMRRGERSEFAIPTSRMPHLPRRPSRVKTTLGSAEERLSLTVELRDIQLEVEVVPPRAVTKHVLKAAEGAGPQPVAYATIDARVVESHPVTQAPTPATQLRSAVLGGGNINPDVSSALLTMREGDLAKVYAAREHRTFLVSLERCVNPPLAIDDDGLEQAQRLRDIASNLHSQGQPSQEAHAYRIFTDALRLLQDGTRFSAAWLADAERADRRRTLAAAVAGNLGLMARESVSLEESQRLLRISAELDPTYRALFRLGRVTRMMGQFVEAVAYLRRAKDLTSGSTHSKEVSDIDAELVYCEEMAAKTA